MLGQPDRVITKNRLLRAVWGDQYAEEAHYLHVYVSRLRRKLAAVDPTGAAGRIISTEPGIGYRLRDPDTQY
jgi:two-component system KDP operon response regulator KdpE